MRYCFLILHIILLSFSGTAQVTIFPEVEKQDVRDIFIKKVEITDFYTIIDFYYHPRGEAWICAEKTFHIIPEGTRDMMYMVVAKNIKICPKKQKVGNFTEDLEFQIWFPKLRRNIYKINVIEKVKRGLNFYGVNIINGQEEPIPDSSQYRSKEDFEKYFGDNIDVLDPIEGIWKMESIVSQYEDKRLIHRKYDQSTTDIAIMKKGDSFNSYDLNGKDLESNCVWVAGGKGYYYREYYREADETISTYVKNWSAGRFEISYDIPEKIARYKLMGDYFPGDRLVQNFLFYKLFPESHETTEENPKKKTKKKSKKGNQ